MGSELEHQHPLVSFAGSMPRLELTAPDPELVDAIARLRIELDSYPQSLFMGTLSAELVERAASAAEDYAAVIRRLGPERRGG